jgi:ribosomal protein S24E
MKIEIIEEKRNDLFSRKELKINIEAEIIPSKEEVKKIITDKFHSNENLVRINKIKGKFGTHLFLIEADIYDSEKEFLRVVKKTKQEVEAEKKAEEERLKAEAEAKTVVAKAEDTKLVEEDAGEKEKEKIKGDE